MAHRRRGGVIGLLAGLAAAGAMAFGGCCASPLHGPADTFVNVTVGPEYERYVREDDGLTEDEKRIRLENVAAFRRLVAEAG